MRVYRIALGLALLVFPACGKSECHKTYRGTANVSNKEDLTQFFCTEDVQGTVWVEDANLTTLTFPALKTVSGNFIVQMNFNLTSLDLPALTNVGGEFHLQTNPSLTSLTVPSLTTIQTLNWRDLSFAVLDVPQLAQTTADFDLTDCNGLTDVTMPNLTAVAGDFVIANTTVASLAGLSQLSSVGGAFVMEYNCALSSSAAQTLWQQVATQQGVGGAVTVANNAGTGSCP